MSHTSTQRQVDRSDRPLGQFDAKPLRRTDFSDTYATPLLPEDSTDPEIWARALFGGLTSGPIGALMRVRDLLVRPFGLTTATDHPPLATGFPMLDRRADALLLGLNDKHLNFQVALTVEQRTLHVTTAVELHNTLGRVYWSVVRLIHPMVMRRMLRRAPMPVT